MQPRSEHVVIQIEVSLSEHREHSSTEQRHSGRAPRRIRSAHDEIATRLQHIHNVFQPEPGVVQMLDDFKKENDVGPALMRERDLDIPWFRRRYGMQVKRPVYETQRLYFTLERRVPGSYVEHD